MKKLVPAKKPKKKTLPKEFRAIPLEPGETKTLEEVLGPNPEAQTNRMYLLTSSVTAGMVAGVLISLVLALAGVAPSMVVSRTDRIAMTVLLVAACALSALIPGKLLAMFVFPRISLSETSAATFFTGAALSALVFSYPLRGSLLVLLLTISAGAVGGYAGGVVLRHRESSAQGIRKAKQDALKTAFQERRQAQYSTKQSQER